MSLSGKKVLVTGACGFIGSHLVEHLIEEGADVKAFVYYNSFGSWGWLDNIEDQKKSSIEVIAGDIRSEDSVRKAVKNSEIVFNLAALIAIPYSYVSPNSYIQTNVIGTLNLLQASLDYDVSRVIQTSTSETYGTAQYVPIDENHPMQAQSPYSASKIGSDAIAKSFHDSYGLPVIIARPFNTYGPRQSNRAIIPTIISQLISGEKEIKLGSPIPTRDFTYVTDTATALACLSSIDSYIGKSINIGSGKEISIEDLSNLIVKLCKKDVDVIFEQKDRMRPENSEVYRLLCDNTLIKEHSNWRPLVSIEDGLKMTIDWIFENIDQYKADTYTL
ncbi:SDR family NAD(P)-dependent oxidoreductase [Gammaproteobacteria bacterium]|nr:SDR family NAD(P)-dependent oxidoreductase [Gammaproteobacteria bacterium]